LFFCQWDSIIVNPTTAVFRNIDMHIIFSSAQHRLEIQCGIVELKRRKSLGLIGTATPNVGKQKYATTLSSGK
jgi:hypothetical protein